MSDLIPKNASSYAHLDHVRLPLVTFQAGDRGEHIFDISMAPVLTFDFRNGRNVPRAESISSSGQQDQ